MPKPIDNKTKGNLKADKPVQNPGPDVKSINGVNPDSKEAKEGGVDSTTYKPQDRHQNEDQKVNVNYTKAY